MRVIPDTTVWIDWLTETPVSFQLGRDGHAKLLVSTIALQELWAGAQLAAERADCERLLHTAQRQRRLVNPPATAWILAGQVLSVLARRSLFGPARLRVLRNDVLLAATAWAYDAAVMTYDQDDFSRIAAVLPVRVVSPP